MFPVSRRGGIHHHEETLGPLAALYNRSHVLTCSSSWIWPCSIPNGAPLFHPHNYSWTSTSTISAPVMIKSVPYHNRHCQYPILSLSLPNNAIMIRHSTSFAFLSIQSHWYSHLFPVIAWLMILFGPQPSAFASCCQHVFWLSIGSDRSLKFIKITLCHIEEQHFLVPSCFHFPITFLTNISFLSKRSH